MPFKPVILVGVVGVVRVVGFVTAVVDKGAVVVEEVGAVPSTDLSFRKLLSSDNTYLIWMLLLWLQK